MKIKQFKQAALDAIIAHPGSTRMEWFRHTFTTDEHRNTMWHVFKFQIAMVLILGGHVKSEGDRFFHVLHQQTLPKDLK